jgi:hypothetical protein
MRVSIGEGEMFRAGRPELVIDDIGYRFATVTAPGINFDVNSTGDRFVFVEIDRDDSDRDRIELVLNWVATLGGG